MRLILIDWILEVHHSIGLNENTLYLSVNLIDRYYIWNIKNMIKLLYD